MIKILFMGNYEILLDTDELRRRMEDLMFDIKDFAYGPGAALWAMITAGLILWFGLEL